MSFAYIEQPLRLMIQQLKENPNFQGILNWIIQIFHYYCRKQHKNLKNSQIIEQNVAISLCSFLCLLWLALPSPSSASGYFQFLDTVECHKWSFVLYIVSFSALKMSFSKLSLAKYHCLHKKTHILCLQLPQKAFTNLSLINSSSTNLSQVVLRRFYMEQFLCNTICMTLICLISSFYTALKR